ncbi:hypothetical protein SORDD17_00384 [Streptococcus oralis]|uniref:Uncharacterized protein n=1 Tax=Streptococcus oralis TaxID=1303 RepID=A0A139RNU7_STROR|nr:hypothetical protein SORDD15_01644 [Streptococcus oralis]KXU16403.1 hypothetical protein SORDD17_00384 [Streptococcus oralis]
MKKTGSKLAKREAFKVEPIFLQGDIGAGEWIGEEYFF